MNEILIKNLAFQAKHQLLGMNCNTNTWKEKFTELILQDCFAKLENSYAPDDLISVEEVILCLKEHFEI